MRTDAAKWMVTIWMVATTVAMTAVAGHAAAIKVDANLPEYTVVSGVGGTLNSIGSDTLNNVMTYWAEAFRTRYPNVNIQI